METNKEQIVIDYSVIKASKEKELVHPYESIWSEVVDTGVGYVDRKPYADIITVTEWLLKQERLMNDKRTAEEKTQFAYQVKLGIYQNTNMEEE